MFSKKLPYALESDSGNSSSLDLWYQEKHNNEVSFGLHVKKVLNSVQSPFQRVDVFESTGFGRVLTLDGLMMCSDRDEFVYHEMISHIPLLVHPNPKRVLVIGGGDGGTLREVLRHDCIEEAVLCEIDGEVVAAAKQFFPALAFGLNHPRAKVHIGDGVEFVKNSANAQFDVVIVDSTDPIGPGVGLFSGEFYKEVKRILTPGGIVAAQCESPWENNIDLSKVYGNLKEAFSSVYSMVGSIPSYPYGYWSWGFASDSVHPFKDINLDKAKAIEKASKYYNVDVHRAAFALPNFLRSKLKNVVENA
ncbi:polyamine aminopropyltransferase [Spirobacillus cienkowskii]|jgi:spermidine synthase|uniref:Polyamine aminopropyltransferase n=1 Tax=Spirobacillus cienkowskii TaxID=495820 RepID=A0A369KRB6_9BACT|nr:MAG: polyamine aminopropyltransferase [Spirobacillus cienkowskii]